MLKQVQDYILFRRDLILSLVRKMQFQMQHSQETDNILN